MYYYNNENISRQPLYNGKNRKKTVNCTKTFRINSKLAERIRCMAWQLSKPINSSKLIGITSLQQLTHKAQQDKCFKPNCSTLYGFVNLKFKSAILTFGAAYFKRPYVVSEMCRKTIRIYFKLCHGL